MTTAQDWSHRIKQRGDLKSTGQMSMYEVDERLTGICRGGVNFVQNPNHDAGFLVQIGYLILDFLVSRESVGHEF